VDACFDQLNRCTDSGEASSDDRDGKVISMLHGGAG
jgi:hypothetical protein